MQQHLGWIVLALVVGMNLYLFVAVAILVRRAKKAEAKAAGRDLKAKEPIVAHAAAEVY